MAGYDLYLNMAMVMLTRGVVLILVLKMLTETYCYLLTILLIRYLYGDFHSKERHCEIVFVVEDDRDLLLHIKAPFYLLKNRKLIRGLVLFLRKQYG